MINALNGYCWNLEDFWLSRKFVLIYTEPASFFFILSPATFDSYLPTSQTVSFRSVFILLHLWVLYNFHDFPKVRDACNPGTALA